jgi:DNA-binding XRE family transcriptional regulator
MERELPGMPAPTVPRKGSLAHTRAQFHLFRDLSRKHHGLTQVSVAAVAIGVSRQRVYQLIEEGRLPTFDILGKIYLPCDEVEAFAAVERDTCTRYGLAPRFA